MWWGSIVGLAIGAWLSYSFILPADVLNLKLAAMTIDDLLHIFGALVATLVAVGIGHLVDIILGNAY
jgi:hypothetical protein